MPEPAKLESTPPTTVILEEIKAVEAGSLRVKVKVAVSPILKVVLLEAMVMVGEVVSAGVVSDAWEVTPKVGVIVWIAEVKPVEAKVRV